MYGLGHRDYLVDEFLIFEVVPPDEFIVSFHIPHKTSYTLVINTSCDDVGTPELLPHFDNLRAFISVNRSGDVNLSASRFWPLTAPDVTSHYFFIRTDAFPWAIGYPRLWNAG